MLLTAQIFSRNYVKTPKHLALEGDQAASRRVAQFGDWNHLHSLRIARSLLSSALFALMSFLALLVYPDGTIGPLESTATVPGFQADWECSVGEVWLCPDDTLLMYTDGVPEAANENDEEFGERRPAEQLLAHACLPHRSCSDPLFRAFSAFLARDFRTTLHWLRLAIWGCELSR
jgi:hypothetical protein